jgi:protein TonB
MSAKNGGAMSRILQRWRLGAAALAGTVTALLPGCSSTPLPPPAESSAPVLAVVISPTPSAVVREPDAVAVAPGTARPSVAATARAYRQDAASHLYGLNQERIWKGRLPPMLYAIGTLQVDLDAQGRVRSLHWMRKPSHAPEVVAEIERTVRAAAPYPAPARMGKVVYTDTWLWHKSGRFQLDTLTEGQD